LALSIVHLAEKEAMPYSPEHKRDTREKIVESARRLFNRRGYSGVSIEEIMSDAGLTHGGFYRHFRGKEELYAAAVCARRRRPPGRGANRVQ
jgi:TetR/AcrR family transcriptional regulator, transcriptional repressor for nem operon